MEKVQSVQNAARAFIDRGFKIVWIDPGKKRPFKAGWPMLDENPDDYDGTSDLGLLCGRRSGDLVCVDIDSDNALSLTDEYLPETSMIEGRPGKRRSHRWYKVTNIPDHRRSSACNGIGGPATRSYRHIDGECLVEIKGTGAQAVVPPSQHRLGQRTWDVDGEPASVDAETLYNAVEALASACGWDGEKKRPKPERPAVRPNTDAVTLATETPKKREWRCRREHTFPLLPMPERVARCRAYVDKCDPAVSGHGGHNATHKVAQLCINDFALDEDDAWDVLVDFNQRCEPPWSDEELRHKLESASRNENYGCKAIASSFDDPERLALEFLTDQHWVYWNNGYYRYTGTHYKHFPKDDVMKVLRKHCHKQFTENFTWQLRQYGRTLDDYEETKQRHDDAKKRNRDKRSDEPKDPVPAVGRRPKVPKPKSVSTGLVVNVTEALASQTRLAEDAPEQLPGWIGVDRGAVFPVANGLLDVDNGVLMPHSSDWFSLVCAPYDFDPTATCPKWEEMLGRSLEGDADRMAVIQEFFGLCLSPNTDTQSALFLLGDGRNGKTVTTAALRAMLGEDNVSTLGLDEFSGQFQLVRTLGKLANICPETNEFLKSEEGALKAFIDGSKMKFEFKYQQPFDAIPTARIVVTTNNFPRFHDRSFGLWRRIKLIPFTYRIKDDEVVPGADKPSFWTVEAPGILNWALRGLQRLRDNGWKFTRSEMAERHLDSLRTDSNPTKEFLTEHYEPSESESDFAVSEDMYRKYKEWMGTNGHKGTLASNRFAQELLRWFPDAKRQRGRVDGNRVTKWLGVKDVT